MKDDLMESTRRCPRSTAQAFADERAQCIEHYPARQRVVFKLMAVVYVLALWVLFAAVFVWAAP